MCEWFGGGVNWPNSAQVIENVILREPRPIQCLDICQHTQARGSAEFLADATLTPPPLFFIISLK